MAQTVTSLPTNTQAALGSPQYASLYVGDLSADVTEAVLYETFSAVGPVASIRVCRDSMTRRSLGYAYVNFHSIADAERALDTLNYSPIKGRACRIMWSHRDPAIRRNASSNVFVKNLDKGVDNKALYDSFSVFGNILSCKVASDTDGKSRGFGFVHFETDEAASKAIEGMNGALMGNKNVSVCIFKKGTERENGVLKNFTNIYVKHLPNHWNEEKIREVFIKFGDITSLCVNIDAKGRRFAFINYKNYEAAKAAVHNMNGVDARSPQEKLSDEASDQEDRKGDLEHPDHLLFVCRAQTKAERESELKSKFNATNPITSIGQGTNLYVKNISEELDDEGLKELFSPYGSVLSAKIMKDDKGLSKGFGFVSFASAEDGTKAVAEMHLKLVNNKPLYVGVHEKREQRIERLQSRYQVAGGMGAQLMQRPQSVGFNQMYSQPNNMFSQPGMVNRAPQVNMPQRPMPGGAGAGMFGGYPGGMQQMQTRFPAQMPPSVMNPAAYNPMLANRNMQVAARPRTQGVMGTAMPPQMSMQRPMPGGPMQGVPMQSNQYQFGNQARNAMMSQSRDPIYEMNAGGPLLTTAVLAAAPPNLQKQMIGERLYPSIQRMQPELAGKITGMMLEMDNSELLILMESETQLRAKVSEAMRVLENRQ